MVNSRFKGAIADAFYDKQFTLRKVTHGKDAEGGATTVNGAETTHSGNVQYTLNARSVEMYGITAKVDLAITTGTDVDAQLDDVIVYDGQEYTVSDVKPRDSHRLIVGTRR